MQLAICFFDGGMGKLTNSLRSIEDLLIGDYNLGHEKRRLFALGCLASAVFIALASYKTEGFLRDGTTNYRPDLISGLFSLFLIAPLYVRNIVPWTGLNVYSLLGLILNWMIVASAANMALEGSRVVKALGGELPMTFLFTVTVAFGWLGMRPVAMISWAAFLLLGTINLSVASDTMGFWGFGFLALSFLGILLQANLSPKHLLGDFNVEFFGSAESLTGEPSSERLPLRQPRDQ